MRGGGGGEIGGTGTGGDDSYNYNRQVHTLIDHGSPHCPMAAMGPHSQVLSIQQSANILWNRSTLLKLEKLSLTILIIYTKAQRIGKSSCLFLTSLDRCTTDAEHWQQQRQHKYVVYVPPHTLCPWFCMLAMFRAIAAEVH